MALLTDQLQQSVLWAKEQAFHTAHGTTETSEGKSKDAKSLLTERLQHFMLWAMEHRTVEEKNRDIKAVLAGWLQHFRP